MNQTKSSRFGGGFFCGRHPRLCLRAVRAGHFFCCAACRFACRSDSAADENRRVKTAWKAHGKHWKPCENGVQNFGCGQGTEAPQDVPGRRNTEYKLAKKEDFGLLKMMKIFLMQKKHCKPNIKMIYFI
ncbi:MAG: hypothetical protein IKN72_11185 [Clostridia bacterium]|nr:hypothetical protein [Clostridia bacterium]